MTELRVTLLRRIAAHACARHLAAAIAALALPFAYGCNGTPGGLTVTTELPGGGATVQDGDAPQTEVEEGDCAGAETQPAGDNLSTIRQATLCLVNAERVKRDRSALEPDARLADAARAKAADMVDNRYFAHTGPDGRAVRDWVEDTDYLDGARRIGLGENLGWASEGGATPLRLVQGWMNSPGHRQNILRTEWTDSGIGVVLGAPREEGGGGATYVQMFGYRGR